MCEHTLSVQSTNIYTFIGWVYRVLGRNTAGCHMQKFDVCVQRLWGVYHWRVFRKSRVSESIMG